MGKRIALIALALAVLAGGTVILLLSLSSADSDGGPLVEVPGGDAARGRELAESYGCATCHTIPGIRSAPKRVGPSLAGFARRRFIAGDEPNTPRELIRWIRHPRRVEPGTAMPDLGVRASEARDIAAFLYSKR